MAPNPAGNAAQKDEAVILSPLAVSTERDTDDKQIAKRCIEVTRETRLSFDLRASGGAAICLRARK